MQNLWQLIQALNFNVEHSVQSMLGVTWYLMVKWFIYRVVGSFQSVLFSKLTEVEEL